MIVVYGLCLLMVVLLVRTIMFRPNEEHFEKTEAVKLDEEKIIERFRTLLQHKTVSDLNPELMDMTVFKAFQESLVDLYPKIHETCERKLIDPAGILYKWEGKSSDKPVVLMSHYDVVPAEESQWDEPPFDAVIKEGYIWARGTLDTKCSLLSVMESVEHLIEEGYQPKNDIYMSFGGDEEINGASAMEIVKYLKANGIRPALVLDEGGVVLEGVFPGVNKPTALIGVGEKGYLDLELTFNSSGGHSSAPPSKSMTAEIGRLLVNVEQKKMKATITPPIKEMFNRLGRHSSFMYRMVFGNLWLFSPLLKLLFTKQGGQMNALIRTTSTTTKLGGSKAFNVMPPVGKVGINTRILNTETIDDVTNYLIGLTDYEVKAEDRGSREASPISPTDCDSFKILEKTIKDIWPESAVSPYLMIAGTDSRHFHEISNHVYRFAPMFITKEELDTIHSNNERIKIQTVLESVEFYIKLVRQL